MAYIITRANGTTQQLTDAILDTTKYSIGVLGRETPDYGAATAEGTVRLLENFANDFAPIQPIPGQLWFDTSTGYMRYNTGITDGQNIWTKIISADASNNIGADSDRYNILYIDNINDEAFLGANTTTVLSENIGTTTTPIDQAYIDIMGTVVDPISQLHVSNLLEVDMFGTEVLPVGQIFVDQIGASGARVSNIYALTVDALSLDATQFGNQIPSYYLDYNNFTNIPNYTSQFLDAAGDTMSGNLTMVSGASVLLDHIPLLSNEPASKQYVDDIFAGIDKKDACRVTTTANITLSGTQTIDGVSLLVGDRVLVKNQSTASQNGIYDVAAGAWTRSTDADGSPSSEVTSGMSTFISDGSTYTGTGWILTTPDPITVGSTALSFSQVFEFDYYSAGTGIDLTGTTFSADFGTSAGLVSEGDHIHANATVSVDGFMSATDKTKLDGIASGAEVNQNTFANIVVSGESTISADLKTDTLTFVAGSDIGITTNSTSDSITITNTSPATNQTIIAGAGMSGGGSGSTVTLNNADGGNAQNIFKLLNSNDGTGFASNNNDTLVAVGALGVDTVMSGNTLTFDAATTSNGIEAIQNAQNGYMLFDGNVLIQWGIVGPVADNTQTAFNFPIAFDTFWSMTAQCSHNENGPGSATSTRAMHVTSIPTSGTVTGGVFDYNDVGSGGSQAYIQYIAFGHRFTPL